MNITAINETHHTVFDKSSEETQISVTEILLVIFALVMSALIIFVNSVTILVIKKTPSLQTFSNIYIASLATSDLVIGICLIPLSMFYIPSIREHYYDQNIKLCALIFGTNLGMAVVSTIHMSLIAVDRYLYILWPYIYQRSIDRRVIYAILLCTWSFGIFYALLPQLIHNDASGVSRCDITLVMPEEYMFYANLSIYTLCVTVNISMYSPILYTACRQRRMIQSKTINRVNIAVTETSQNQRNKQYKSNNQSVIPNEDIEQEVKDSSAKHISHNNNWIEPQRKTSSRMKSVRFFMTVFGVHFLCLTPTVICMGIDYHWRVVRFLYNIFNLLALLNSGMNFLIYFILNARFRLAVLKLFKYRGAVASMETTDGSYLDG